MRFYLWFLVVVSLTGPVFSKAPEVSIRPILRGGAAPVEADNVLATPSLAKIRPHLRPIQTKGVLADNLAQALALQNLPAYVAVPQSETEAERLAFATLSPQAIGSALRPSLRPKSMVEKVMAKRRARQKGAVCGDPDLQGEAVGYVPGRINGCGIKDAISLRSVSGVPLSQHAQIDCTTAKALKTWVNKGLKPAVGSRGGGVLGLRVAAHYACRPRNNQSGAKISEHGRGRAIDISGVTLRDGSEITVLGGWGSKRDGAVLRKMHKAACGPFGTVLGPQSDRFHQDHFHFDTARYRSGAYCR
ncbi:extensin family protein [Puniceibacterium sp. IMCC21224]|uniref:extensin-like domain-containing protein n=1 Tax=Puniceibacterium sp. IMCC21224 TaxID=1618204 RepID=UPI00064DAC84|nr:extensin family protein [Puniceibacterium sp. IMCC21224]KMK65906.1 extensin-like protein [Puniceibacterium sp. IMCC21224]